MIVYLGMPRSASSWLYDHLKHLSPSDTKKETHYLYETPDNILEYCKSRALEFSTNNWSMDSSVATAIDPYVSKYILIFRNPVEFARSYQIVGYKDTDTIDNIIDRMFINKLLCYGDIVERWYSIVDPNKIIIADYSDIEEDSTAFINQLIEQLGVIPPIQINPNKTNNIGTYEPKLISQVNLKSMTDQVEKLERITNRKFKWTINNKL